MCPPNKCCCCDLRLGLFISTIVSIAFTLLGAINTMSSDLPGTAFICDHADSGQWFPGKSVGALGESGVKMWFVCERSSGELMLEQHPSTWIEASKACVTQGMQLATIGDAQKNQKVREVCDGNACHIGVFKPDCLRQKALCGGKDWQWLKQTNYSNYTTTSTKLPYTNWVGSDDFKQLKALPDHQKYDCAHMNAPFHHETAAALKSWCDTAVPLLWFNVITSFVGIPLQAFGAFAIHSYNASFTRTYFFIWLFFIVVQSLPGFYGLVKLFLVWPAAALFVSIAFIISYGLYGWYMYAVWSLAEQLFSGAISADGEASAEKKAVQAVAVENPATAE